VPKFQGEGTAIVPFGGQDSTNIMGLMEVTGIRESVRSYTGWRRNATTPRRIIPWRSGPPSTTDAPFNRLAWALS
jgi:hypothetical protein